MSKSKYPDQFGVYGKTSTPKASTAGRPVKTNPGTENKGTKTVVHRAGNKKGK